MVHCCGHKGIGVTRDIAEEAMPMPGAPYALNRLDTGLANSVRSTAHYRVRLSRMEAGGRLGIDIEHDEEASSLPIVGITGGAAEAWNKVNPMRLLRPGDAIVEVNGCRGNVGEMLAACQRDAILDLTVQKDAVPALACHERTKSREAACICQRLRHAPCTC